jgi:hypothetical protein
VCDSEAKEHNVPGHERREYLSQAEIADGVDRPRSDCQRYEQQVAQLLAIRGCFGFVVSHDLREMHASTSHCLCHARLSVLPMCRYQFLVDSATDQRQKRSAPSDHLQVSHYPDEFIWRGTCLVPSHSNPLHCLCARSEGCLMRRTSSWIVSCMTA